MNLFLINANIHASCRRFAKLDPLRARKQLLEACQLLSSVDYLLWGKTEMKRQDGQMYNKGYIHHPLTKHMAISRQNYILAYEIALGLANEFPGHACGRSLQRWTHGPEYLQLLRNIDVIAPMYDKAYCVCRKGVQVIYVPTIEEYASLMHEYLITHKWANDTRKPKLGTTP